MSSLNFSPRRPKFLFWLLIANVMATIFHYTDNVCYFHLYPEPTWLNPRLVDAFWFIMTPLAPVGYLLLKRGFHRSGCCFLYAYAAASLLVLGHYLLAPFYAISVRIHFFILLEAALALVLAVYVAWLQSRRVPAIA